MASSHTLIGAKFYNEETNDLIRLTRVRNGNCFIGFDTDGNTKRLTRAELDKYKKIRPVGILSFYQVGLEGGDQDIIVTLHRSVDMDKQIILPFIVCRQCIIDMFAMAVEQREGITNVGLCMSAATCPENVDFNIMLQYKSVIRHDIVSIYLDDTLDVMLSFINPVNYNSVIAKAKASIDPDGIRNCSKDLKGLLEDNFFMTEFNIAYNIIDLKSKENLFEMVDDTFARCTDYATVVVAAEKAIGYKIFNIAFMVYDEYADLAKVSTDGFIFVRNNIKDNTIYIMKFSKGEKVLITDKIRNESDRELIGKMASLIKR